MTHRLTAPFAATLALSACSSTSAGNADETTDAVEESQPVIDRDARAKAALKVVSAFASSTKSYFMSEQMVTADEPWHTSVYGNGYPIEWSLYSFAGGPNFTFTTHTIIPRGGEALPATLDASNPMAAAVLATIDVDLSGDHHFRYTYSTGPGTGPDASALITAEADFDPASPEVHTILVELEIDNESQEIIVRPPVTMNEFM